MRVAHAYVAEHGQCDRQPDGHCVDDDAEAGVEEHEANSRQRVTHRGRFRAVKAVELQRERQVGCHREAVRDGEPGEDAVRRRHHVRASQHDDVTRVRQDAAETYYSRQVAVITLVRLAQV